METGSVADWFSAIGTWIGSLGTIAAFFIVIFQIKEDKKIANQQAYQEDEREFSKQRQLFRVNLAQIDTKNSRNILDRNGDIFSQDVIKALLGLERSNKDTVLTLKNLSHLHIIATKLIISYTDNSESEFRVDSIDSLETVNFFDIGNLYDEFNKVKKDLINEIIDSSIDEQMYNDAEKYSFIDKSFDDVLIEFANMKWDDRLNQVIKFTAIGMGKSVEDLYQEGKSYEAILKIKLASRVGFNGVKTHKIIDEVKIYYMTPIRERIKVVFSYKDGLLEYQRDKKVLEHKLLLNPYESRHKYKELNSVYTLNEFDETPTYKEH